MSLPSPRPGAPVRYRDRETGEVRAETIPSERGLRFLYETASGRLLVRTFLARRWVSRGVGWLQRTRRSRGGIPRFVEKTGIDVSEAELPPDAYPSLDAFFTRRLRPGVRPIDRNPKHLISPADGRILVYPEVRETPIHVKGCAITLRELLVDSALADRCRGGSLAVIRLAPVDYHRFHFPEDGTASKPRVVGSGLHSVNPVALASGLPVFRNRREITRLETRRFGTLLLIEVGALFVGSIRRTCMPGNVCRGDEKGYFRFGGSTVVLVAERARVRFDDDLIEASSNDLETLVKFGTRIARRG